MIITTTIIIIIIIMMILIVIIIIIIITIIKKKKKIIIIVIIIIIIIIMKIIIIIIYNKNKTKEKSNYIPLTFGKIAGKLTSSSDWFCNFSVMSFSILISGWPLTSRYKDEHKWS